MKSFTLKPLALLIIISVVGCGNKIKVTPNELPDAYLNEPYSVNLQIINDSTPFIEDSLYFNTSSANFEITTDLETYQHGGLNLTIKGTPASLQPVDLILSGATYRTNLSGSSFEKKYKINIKPVPNYNEQIYLDEQKKTFKNSKERVFKVTSTYYSDEGQFINIEAQSAKNYVLALAYDRGNYLDVMEGNNILLSIMPTSEFDATSVSPSDITIIN